MPTRARGTRDTRRQRAPAGVRRSRVLDGERVRDGLARLDRLPVEREHAAERRGGGGQGDRRGLRYRRVGLGRGLDLERLPGAVEQFDREPGPEEEPGLLPHRKPRRLSHGRFAGPDLARPHGVVEEGGLVGGRKRRREDERVVPVPLVGDVEGDRDGLSGNRCKRRRSPSDLHARHALHDEEDGLARLWSVKGRLLPSEDGGLRGHPRFLAHAQDGQLPSRAASFGRVRGQLDDLLVRFDRLPAMLLRYPLLFFLARPARLLFLRLDGLGLRRRLGHPLRLLLLLRGLGRTGLRLDRRLDRGLRCLHGRRLRRLFLLGNDSRLRRDRRLGDNGRLWGRRRALSQSAPSSQARAPA